MRPWREAWGAAAASRHNATHAPASCAPHDAEARGGLLGEGGGRGGGHVRWQCAYQARARPTYCLPSAHHSSTPTPNPTPTPTPEHISPGRAAEVWYPVDAVWDPRLVKAGFQVKVCADTAAMCR